MFFYSRLGLYHLMSHPAKFQSILMKNDELLTIQSFCGCEWLVVDSDVLQGLYSADLILSTITLVPLQKSYDYNSNIHSVQLQAPNSIITIGSLLLTTTIKLPYHPSYSQQKPPLHRLFLLTKLHIHTGREHTSIHSSSLMPPPRILNVKTLHSSTQHEQVKESKILDDCP